MLVDDAGLNTGDLAQAPLRRVREAVPLPASDLSCHHRHAGGLPCLRWQKPQRHRNPSFGPIPAAPRPPSPKSHHRRRCNRTTPWACYIEWPAGMTARSTRATRSCRLNSRSNVPSPCSTSIVALVAPRKHQLSPRIGGAFLYALGRRSGPSALFGEMRSIGYYGSLRGKSPWHSTKNPQVKYRRSWAG